MLMKNEKNYTIKLAILVFLCIPGVLLAEERIISDPLKDGSKIHSMSDGWRFSGPGAASLDFDPDLLARRQDNEQYITYHYNNITDFELDVFIHESIVMSLFISEDGAEWSEYSYLISNKAYRQGGWRKRIYTNKDRLPDNTNYFKIVVYRNSGTEKAFSPNLSHVKLWIENSRYTKLVEDFADSSVVSYSSPGWNWDVAPRLTGSWDGDSTQLNRDETTEQYLVYNKANLAAFDLILYLNNNYYLPEKLRFFISPDGDTFTEIGINSISKGLNAPYGRYIFRARELFPKGTNFLKIVVEEGLVSRGSLWFSSLSLYYNYQYSGYNYLTDPCQDFNHVDSKSNGWKIDKNINNATELSTFRFHKKDNTDQHLIYRFEDIANFKATVYWHSEIYSPETFAFYISPDNVTYQEIDYEYKIATLTVNSPPWNKVIYQPANPIPKGNNYIKIESKAVPGTANFLPRINDISFSQGPHFLYEDDFGLYDLSPKNPETTIEASAQISFPENFILEQNYPNPFNPKTNIEIKLSVTADVKLEIYNTIGQRIANIAQEKMLAGHYSFTWDGRDSKGRLVNSGIYFYRLTTESKLGSYSESKKMILMK